eukprot:13064-Heterococcus_DN1.PRE.2
MPPHSRKPVVLQGKDPVTPFEKRLAQPVTDADIHTDNADADNEDAVMDLKGSSEDSSSSGSGDEQGEALHSIKASTKALANSHDSHDNRGASTDEGAGVCGIHFSDSAAQAASTHHVDAMDAALALCEQAHYVPPVSSATASATTRSKSTTASTKQAGTGSGSSTAAGVIEHTDAAADDTVAMHVDTADTDSTRGTTITNSSAAQTSAGATPILVATSRRASGVHAAFAQRDTGTTANMQGGISSSAVIVKSFGNVASAAIIESKTHRREKDQHQ